MKIGIVSFWFNRGQATVGRGIREICLSLGHEVCVLSRPSDGEVLTESQRKLRSGELEPGVTEASRYNIPVEEYLAWINRERPAAVFFFQNYQFEAIAAVREAGVKTVGCFMWEDFQDAHVAGAKRAFSCVYALTRSSARQFAAKGLESEFVRWGCLPSDVERAKNRPAPNRLRVFTPGGFVSGRKCMRAVLEAWKLAAVPGAELIVKIQRPMRPQDLIYINSIETFMQVFRAAATSSGHECDKEVEAEFPGVRVLCSDMNEDEYFELFSSCGLCLAPSRWEGLGLHLYEATALGIPLICNDMPPLNEIAVDGKNALLTPCRKVASRPSDVSIMEPDIKPLAAAIRHALDPENFNSLCIGAQRRRDELSWENTRADFAALIEGLGV